MELVVGRTLDAEFDNNLCKQKRAGNLILGIILQTSHGSSLSLLVSAYLKQVLCCFLILFFASFQERWLSLLPSSQQRTWKEQKNIRIMMKKCSLEKQQQVWTAKLQFSFISFQIPETPSEVKSVQKIYIVKVLRGSISVF